MDGGAVFEAGGMRYIGHRLLREKMADQGLAYSDLSDVEGFVTTEGRFIDRDEAKKIALVCGQIKYDSGRELLSSDIDWEGTK